MGKRLLNESFLKSPWLRLDANPSPYISHLDLVIIDRVARWEIFSGYFFLAILTLALFPRSAGKLSPAWPRFRSVFDPMLPLFNLVRYSLSSRSSLTQRFWPLLLVTSLGFGGTSGCAMLQSLRPGGAEAQGGGFRPGDVQVFPVSTQRLEAQSLEDSSLFIGTLRAAQRVTLKPETDGRVTQIFVSPGDRLDPGDPIIRLSPTRSQAALTAAQANVSAAQASHTSATAQWRSSQAQVRQLEAEVALQNADFERISRLVQEGALAQQALDRVVRDRDTALASLTVAKEQVSANAALIEEAQAALEQANAQVLSVQEDLKDNTIVAPITGIVGDLAVKVGDYLETGDTLTTLTDNRSLELDLPIPVEYRDRLRTTLTVELRNYTNETIIGQGSIGFISPTVDNTNQSILAKATFQNSEGTLRDQQQVEARVIWGAQSGVIVPTEAVVRLGGQTFVFVTQAQGDKTIVEQRPVQLGTLQGNNYQVQDGLTAGEDVVVLGMLNLRDGAQVVIQPPGS